MDNTNDKVVVYMNFFLIANYGTAIVGTLSGDTISLVPKLSVLILLMTVTQYLIPIVVKFLS